jgi:pimeloyl-ACP methyl ester carboxylesterase
MLDPRQKIYAIGGLGADHRIFQFLNLNANIHVLKWEKPQQKEPLSDYVLRMSKQIPPEFEGWLIGVSFGGMVAQEIAKRSNVKVILISSVAQTNEVPKIYQWVGKTRLISILPAFLFKLPKGLAVFLFGAKNKRLLMEIIRDTDPNFVKWALQKITTWENHQELSELRIHGKKDRLFPLKNAASIDFKTNGGHFTIVDEAAEISRFLTHR